MAVVVEPRPTAVVTDDGARGASFRRLSDAGGVTSSIDPTAHPSNVTVMSSPAQRLCLPWHRSDPTALTECMHKHRRSEREEVIVMADVRNREPGQEVRRPGRWSCRLHVWHRWRTHRYPDGSDYGAKYQECLDCGKQRDVPAVASLVA